MPSFAHELADCPDFGLRALLRLERVIKQTEHWRLLENQVAKYSDLDFGDPYDALKFLKINFWLRTNILRAVRLNLHRQPRMKVMDLGCGSSMLPFVCRFWGHDAVGLDRPLDQFSRAEKIVYGSLPEILGVSVQREDIQAYVPIALDQSYDLIYAFMVCFNQHQQAHEWTRDEWDYCLRDLCRHVNAGGKLFLSLNEHTAKYGDLRYYDEPTRDLFESFGYVDHRGGVPSSAIESSPVSARTAHLSLPPRLPEGGCLMPRACGLTGRPTTGRQASDTSSLSANQSHTGQ